MIQATAALLSGEKVVANAVTNTNGGFTIHAPREGSYTLKITYVGFKPYSKTITLKERSRPIPLSITRARIARPRDRWLRNW